MIVNKNKKTKIEKKKKDPLTFNKFQKITWKRSLDVFPDCETWSEMDWGCSLAGEVGELCNMLKKRKRGKEIPLEEVGKELADSMSYISVLASKLGLNLEKIMTQKFNEVSEKRNSKIRL